MRLRLLDGMGKLGRKLERPGLATALEQQAPTVLGSIPGGLSLAVHHEIRAYQAVSRAYAWPSATLYIDATSAYYRVLREAFFQDIDSDCHFFHVLQTLGVDPDHFQQVAAWAFSTELLGNLAPHSKRVIKTFMHATAFRFEGAPDLMQSRAGTRPGDSIDSIADLLYSFLLQDMLREVAASLPEAASDPVLCQAGIAHPFQGTWADDVAQPFSAPDCESLISKAEHIVSVYDSAMIKRAVQPNYTRGKTELAIAFRGSGAMKSKKALLVCKEALLRVHTGQRELRVHCVQAYTQLGGIIHVSGKPSCDIAQKAATALAAVRPAVHLRTRLQLLNSLGFSRLFYSAATWGPLQKKDTAALSHAFASLYGLLDSQRGPNGQPRRSSEQDLCRLFGVPPAALRLSTERVAHLARAAFCSDTLMQLRLRHRSLTPGYKAAMQDVRMLVRGSLLPPAAATNFPRGFLDFAAYEPRAMAHAVQRARHADGSGCGPLFPCVTAHNATPSESFACKQFLTLTSSSLPMNLLLTVSTQMLSSFWAPRTASAA